MKKDNKELNSDKKERKLTPQDKELIVTIIVLLCAIVVGFFIGKWLFETLH